MAKPDPQNRLDKIELLSHTPLKAFNRKPGAATFALAGVTVEDISSTPEVHHV